MKVLVTGATGVIGRPVLDLLVAAGHDVHGVARSELKADGVRAAGAAPVSLDLFDAAAIDAAIGRLRPDAIMHLATHIPPVTRALLPGAMRDTIRLRRESSRHLVDAALAHGVGRYLQESIAFIYSDGGDDWLDEDAPIAAGPHQRAAAVSAAQTARVTAAGGDGVLLRFGMFYGATARDTRYQLERARAGKAAVMGPPDAYASTIRIEDAAAAAVAALRAPGGVYNVVEDAPARRRELNRHLAEALGVEPPPLVPAWALRLSRKSAMFARSQRISNRRLRAATGWAPVWPSPAVGWPAVVAELAEPNRRGTAAVPRGAR